MNPWKEVVTTAHHILDLSDQVATPHKPLPLGVRLTSLLRELAFARDRAREIEAQLKFAQDQIKRQAETIRKLQPPDEEPPSEVPPSPTVEQFNAKVVEEVNRRARTRRKKRRDEGI